VAIAAAAIQGLRDRRAQRRIGPVGAPRRSAWFDAGLRDAHGNRWGG